MNLGIQAGPGTNPCGYLGTSVGGIKIYTLLPGMGAVRGLTPDLFKIWLYFADVCDQTLGSVTFSADNKDSILSIDLIVEETFITILMRQHIIS